MKLHKLHFTKFWFFLIIASGFSMPVMADCTSMNFIGASKITQLDNAINSYDQLALQYNQNMNFADTAFAEKTDLNAPWGNVIASRNALIKASDNTKTALGELFTFNKGYISMGCIQADMIAVEAEYKQSIARLDKSQQTLRQVPVDWRIRYQKAISCEKLNTLADETDERGRNWSKKYDRVIDEFKIADTQLTEMSVLDPAYAELQQKVIDLKKQALPGVNGYPVILSNIYDATIKLQQKGCIALDPTKLANYQSQHQTVLTEIRTVQSQMQTIKQPSPTTNVAAPQKPKNITMPQLRSSPEAILTVSAPPIISAPTPITQTINLRNRSGGILCLYIAQTKQMACDFMPNTLRKVNASSVTAFGGGYWSSDGNYMEMKVCRNILPGNTIVQVTRGLDPDCQATR